jgi:hypothetical protein
MVGSSTIVTGNHKYRVPKGYYIPLFNVTAFMGAGTLVVLMPDLSAIVADVGVRLSH